jgi:hypothetical protein
LDPELARVLALPRHREPTPAEIEALSAHLRLREFDDDGERNVLRPQQFSALRSLYEIGGLVAPMPVGAGKTLITLLAATLLGSRVPVLLLPASLKSKTVDDFAEYRKNWRVRLPHMLSYTIMSHASHEFELERLAPDLLLADECDTIKRDNSVTRRLRRYRLAHPECVYAPMSGTLLGEKMMEYHHLLTWSLRTGAPVPLSPAEAERWASAIDNEVTSLRREAPPMIPGGFHEWMRATPGIVSGQGVTCGASIRISPWSPPLPEVLTQTIERTMHSGMRPDGELLDEWGLPDCLSQLALGFYYVWDPMPPDWWLRPRRAWFAYVRAVLDEHLEGFDTQGQIEQALDRFDQIAGGDFAIYPHGAHAHRVATRMLPGGYEDAAKLLAAWRAVKKAFVPNPVPVWIDDTPLQQAVQHTAGKGVLVWTPYIAAGVRLEELGLPYYHADLNPEHAKPGQTIALSQKAHHRGKNLQAWHRNLILKPAAKQEIHEQQIGRTHRSKQLAPTIYVEFLQTIEYHRDVLARVLSSARATTRASGVPHKLVLADWITE